MRYNASKSLLSRMRVGSFAHRDRKCSLARSSRCACSLARPMRSLARCVRSLVAMRSLARLLRCDNMCSLARSSRCDTLARSLDRDTIKNVLYCCLLVAIQHKNTIVVRHRLYPRDVTAKNVDVIASRNMTNVPSRERWHKSQMVA